MKQNLLLQYDCHVQQVTFKGPLGFKMHTHTLSYSHRLNVLTSFTLLSLLLGNHCSPCCSAHLCVCVCVCVCVCNYVLCMFCVEQMNQNKLPSRVVESRAISRGPDFTPAFADFGRQMTGGRGAAVSHSYVHTQTHTLPHFPLSVFQHS